MIVAFDTETTGLPDWRAPSDADHQPHLVQLAMILLDDALVERASVSVIIRPDGWKIPDAVAEIHGITTEIALAVGIPEKVAVDLYLGLMRPEVTAVAHNIEFDLRLMRIAMLRAGFDKGFQERSAPKSTFCTMNAAKPVVNMPPTAKMVAAGFNKPKPPRLSECIKHFFGEELEGAHDALVDVRACVRVFHHLKSLTPPETI